ncbi:hypothetical protein D3C87_1036570 [compost metagenome]
MLHIHHATAPGQIEQHDRNQQCQDHRGGVQTFDTTDIRQEAGADDLEIGGERANVLATQHEQRQAAEHQHARQRHDEGRNAVIGDPVTLGSTDDAADDKTNQRREKRVHAPLHGQYGRDRTDEGDDGADRKVDMPGHDDEQHAQRHDDDERVLQDEVGQVHRAEQDAAGVELEENHDSDERDQHAVFADIGANIRPDRDDVAFFVCGVCRTHEFFSPERMIARMMLSWLASPFGNSATMRPSFMT